MARPPGGPRESLESPVALGESVFGSFLLRMSRAGVLVPEAQCPGGHKQGLSLKCPVGASHPLHGRSSAGAPAITCVLGTGRALWGTGLPGDFADRGSGCEWGVQVGEEFGQLGVRRSGAGGWDETGERLNSQRKKRVLLDPHMCLGGVEVEL